MENEFKIKILEILKKAIDISINSQTDAFVDYSGHVNCLDLRIYYSGWKEGSCPGFNECIYFDSEDKKDIVKALSEFNTQLDELLSKIEREAVND